MVTYSVQITKPAEYDLNEIGRYISKELLEPEIARKVMTRIADAISSLENMCFRK
jgi:toxin ParE1/3/4